MKGFDSIRAKSAVKSRNSIPLDRSHQTTMDFGQIGVLMNEETVPGDKFSFKGSYFSRMSPLVKPTYGKFSFNTATFFVPYYQIADDAEAFFAGKTYFNSNLVSQRYITLNSLVVFLTQSVVSTDVTAGVSGGTVTKWDFAYVDTTGTQKYRTFTTLGKYWVTVLTQLGYAVPEGVDLQSSPASTWYTNLRGYKLSAYPLLAFFKAYNDWMSNSARYNTSALSRILNNIRHNVTDSVAGYSNNSLTGTTLIALFTNLKLTYESDYFTSAWRYPVSVVGGSDNIGDSVVPGSPATNNNANNISTYGTFNDNVLQVGTSSPASSAIYTLGQRALDFLKSFDDWVRRNNYSGSKSVQNLYARFGIKTEDYRSNYAHLLGTSSEQINVGDVTQTAGTSSGVLGDYAGKGIMSSENGLSIDVSDFGLLMVIGYFTVKPVYSYGFDKKVLRNNPLDYYNPDFDGIGAEAIPLMEIFENGTQPAAGDSSSSDSVYGFTERYNSYRFGRDQITGEFRDFFSGSDMNVWHTGRLLNALRAGNLLEAMSDAMVYFDPTSSEYNRIFSVPSGAVNHFYLTAFFQVDAVRPMLDKNQAPRLGTGDTVIDRNGTQLS